MPHCAGRDTDRLIALRFAGFVPDPRVPGAFRPPDDPSVSPMPVPAPHYSSDIGAAFQLIELLIAGGYDVALFTTATAERDTGQWTCAIASGELGTKAHADTAPLAICQAVLALVEAAS